jgi:hypothetical protein
LTKERAMPANPHDDDSLGFEPSGPRAHDPAQAQPGDVNAERSGQPAPTEGNRATGAGCHAAHDRQSAEAARENDWEAKKENVTEEMIEAGIAVLCDSQWSTSGLIEWVDSLTWSGGARLAIILSQMYQAMRAAELSGGRTP